MTSLDEKAQAQLVRWIMKHNPGQPRLWVQVTVFKIAEMLDTPDTVKNAGAIKLGGLKELIGILGISKRDAKVKTEGGAPGSPKKLEFDIAGLSNLPSH